MKKRVLLCALAGTLALTGCNTFIKPAEGGSATPGFATNPDCPDTIQPRNDFCGTSLCAIAVQVVADPATGKCMVVVGSPVMKMLPGNHPSPTPDVPGVAIYWWLPFISKWEFRAEPPTPPPAFATPIIFKTAGASSQFLNLKVGPAGRTVTLYDKNTNSTQYDYKVRVYNKATNQPLESTDPSLINDAN